MTEHSKKFEIIKRYYDEKIWGKRKVADAVAKEWITAAEYEEITGEPYDPDNLPAD